ncbi:MAG: HlyD family efflux transporter periplasmic adaptor subunit, partial [Chloroflexi bacterium]|nr:HlyD family efflux transporter periplasmic adaptor subunit [Chloroflexota bacterium]
AKAKADVTLDQAQQALDEFAPDHTQEIAVAREARARAEVARDTAEENLANFDIDFAQRLAKARETETKAKVALKASQDKLKDLQFAINSSRPIDEDSDNDTKNLRAAEALAQSDLDKAADSLAKLIESGDQFTLDQLEAQAALARAKLDTATQALLDLQEGKGTLKRQRLSSALDVAETDAAKKLEALKRLEEGADPIERIRLLAALDLAQADLDKERDDLADLADLEDGPDPLKRQQLKTAAAVAEADFRAASESVADILTRADPEAAQRQANVVAAAVSRSSEVAQSSAGTQGEALADAQVELATAQDALGALAAGTDPLEVYLKASQVTKALADLREAEKDLAELLDGLDPLDLDLERQKMELARANLAQAEEDLDDLTTNIDPLQIQLRQAQVRQAQASLHKAETHLSAIRDQIPLEVALREAEVLLAEETSREALEDFQGATVRAPFDGIVSLVNVDPDDQVDENSRVIELVDPSVVEVAGLVNAADVSRVANGATAKVTIGSLAGRVLSGKVIAVSTSPRTERGVVSYPVKIRVEIPDGVQIPIGLSSITVVVTHQEKGVLLVPRNAVQSGDGKPVVLVFQDGAIQRRPVVLGNGNDEWVAVLDGLEAGERVVV